MVVYKICAVWLACAVFFCFSPVPSRAQDNSIGANATASTANVVSTGPAGVPQFVLDYTSVDHTRKDDSGYAFELIKLFAQDNAAASVLAQYWENEAAKSCNAAGNATACRKDFYEAHWDAVNTAIAQRCRTAKIYIREKE